MGVPRSARSELPIKRKPRNRTTDPAKVRERAAEPISTPDVEIPKTPAKRLPTKSVGGRLQVAGAAEKAAADPSWAEVVEMSQLLEAN